MSKLLPTSERAKPITDSVFTFTAKGLLLYSVADKGFCTMLPTVILTLYRQDRTSTDTEVYVHRAHFTPNEWQLASHAPNKNSKLVFENMLRSTNIIL